MSLRGMATWKRYSFIVPLGKSGMHVSLHVGEGVKATGLKSALSLYRILQELQQHVTKHAAATKAAVHITGRAPDFASPLKIMA